MALNATPVPATSGRGPSGPFATAGSRFRQPGFWVAIAGMALALTIACVVVATEMIGQYGNRATHFQRKMDRLQAKISQMQLRLASANRQVGEMRREAAYPDEFERGLPASDSQL